MKNKGIIYVLSILLAIILLGGCSIVGTYNGLVSEQSKVEQAQADVATALQRRSDLIGNLVESVKGQMNHETEVFTKIAEARAKIGNGSVTSKENQEAQGEVEFSYFTFNIANRKLSRTQEQSKCGTTHDRTGWK